MSLAIRSGRRLCLTFLPAAVRHSTAVPLLLHFPACGLAQIPRLVKAFAFGRTSSQSGAL